MEQKSSLQLQDFLPYRLSVLSNNVSSLLASLYTEKFGISIPEWRMVAVLGEEPGLTSTQIASRVAMDKVAVTRAVQSLIEKRLVRRSSSQADGRVSHLNLTKAGQRVYDEVVPMALAVEHKVWGALAPAEKDYWDEMLSKMERRVSTLREELLEINK